MTTLDPFLEGLPPLGGLIGIACVTIAGGLMRGFTGFGAAMIIIPVTALVTLPRDAVVYHAMIEIPTALQLLPDGLRNARRSTVLPMIFGLVVAVPAGMLLLTRLPSDMMRVTMSVAVLCLVAFMWVGGRLPPPRGIGAGVIGGLAGGILQGGVGVGGPPIAAALIARRDTPQETRGNVLVMMALIILVSIPSQYAFNLINGPVLKLGIVMAPIYMVSTVSGSWLFRRTGGHNYRSVAMTILAVTALSTLVMSLV